MVHKLHYNIEIINLCFFWDEVTLQLLALVVRGFSPDRPDFNSMSSHLKGFKIAFSSDFILTLSDKNYVGMIAYMKICGFNVLTLYCGKKC